MNYHYCFTILLMMFYLQIGDTKNKIVKKRTRKSFPDHWVEHVLHQSRRAESGRRDYKPLQRARGYPYIPNYAYEGYWAATVSTTQNVSQSTPGTLNCGAQCAPVFSSFGKICARNKDYEYKTFENYCAMKSADCLEIEDWKVVHLKECGDYLNKK
ncbi:uncharacterized protein LOC142983663 [Anticarsia gemmatalis]|uniref:uncharacterized protein LOC142983663 n=1 Tax=Anticarsia gemmatalis TaxID=129554 RepID=UPI003F75CB53